MFGFCLAWRAIQFGVPVFTTLCLFQLRLLASDFGYPSLTSTATVGITVRRNLRTPLFTNTNTIRVVIPENAAIGTFIADLNATDSDTDVSGVWFVVVGLG